MEQVEILATPIKSESDKKEYRMIKLQNGLKTLLIRTHESSAESTAAAALLVSVGSFHEPRSVGGLAHFLEHMLFLGSEKYPDEGGFSKLISANGGEWNAMTTEDFTCYFCKIFEETFDEVFDRFADMLLRPLLVRNAIQREREAVDSEYQLALSSEHHRRNMVLKSLFKEDHPATCFGFGNLKSLKEDISDDDLHEQMLKLFKEYVVNRMFVCLQSRKSLDEMQAMVVEKFAAFESGNDDDEIVQVSDFDVDRLVRPDFFEKLVFVKPLIAEKFLILNYVLPQQITSGDCEPLKYVQKIFDNDGEGGLKDWLKRKNLAINFSMHEAFYGTIYFNRQFSIVQLVTELTEHGMENMETVLDVIFSYLLLLKEATMEEHKRLFAQFKRQNQVNFKFEQEMSAEENVQLLAMRSLYNSDVDILRTSAAVEFNEHAIMDVINRLNELRFNVTIVDDKREKYGKRERYFNVEYDEVDLPASYRTLWENRKLSEEFSLPQENPFEPMNFDIKVNGEESSKYPAKIFEDATFEVWHKLDGKFNLPKATVKLQFVVAKHLESLDNYLLFDIYKCMFDTHIRKKLAQAFNSNFTLEMKTSHSGMKFEFTGFSDKLELFIEMFFREFTNITEVVTEVAFEQATSERKKELYEYIMEAQQLNRDYLKLLLIDKIHTDYELYKAIDGATCSDVQKIIPMVFERLKIKILAQGNITREETMKIVKIIDWSFDNEPYNEELEIHSRAYQLPLSTSNVLRIRSPAVINDNSMVVKYYQIGRMTIQSMNMARILESYIEPKAFDCLRTKHQLSYNVGARIETLGGTIGLMVYVNSQEKKNKFTKVLAKIVEFIDKTLVDINGMGNAEFEGLKASRLKTVRADDVQLQDEVKRNWLTIEREYYKFNKQEMFANVTAKLTKEEFIYFINSFLKPEKQRAVALMVIGNERDDGEIVNDATVELITDKYDEHENVITDIKGFQESLYLYPVLKVLE